jgi:hypothetical protein
MEVAPRARYDPAQGGATTMTISSAKNGLVLQGYFRRERSWTAATRPVVVQLMEPARPMPRPPRPELLPPSMRGGAAQGRPARAPGAAWPGAPRPELLPGMGPSRIGGPPPIAQARSGPGVSVSPIPVGRLRVIGPGRPLEPGIRRIMERFFLADFSGIRVHEGPAAQAMGALAFTLGEELHFAPGRYDPSSREGVELLGHELTHVVQQRDGRVVNPYGHGIAIVQDPALEAEADRMGQQIADQVWSGHRAASSAMAPNAAIGGRVALPRAPRGLALSGSSPPAAVAQRSWIAAAVGSLFESKSVVPPGVEPLRTLPGGFGVGYRAKDRRILLYGPKGVIAHIEIMMHPASDASPVSSVSLHTHTDKGAEGGQGHMTTMFADTLIVVAAEFSQFELIEMAPAIGAATKGLVSLLSRLRMKLPVPKATGAAIANVEKAMKLLAEADHAREKRKQAKGSAPKAQVWDSAMMKETVLELCALAEMEKAYSTGLAIIGMTGAYAGQLVGDGSPIGPGTPQLWYESAEETTQGMLQFTIPMASIDLYIAALGDDHLKAMTKRRSRLRWLRRLRHQLEEEDALREARAILDRRPPSPPPPQVETIEDLIKNNK